MDKVILGIDPGTAATGYGLLSVQSGDVSLLDYGVIRPPKSLPLFDRYHVLFQSIKQLIGQYKPNAVCVEGQFVQKNAQSALKLGMAKGAAILAAKEYAIDCFEYYPRQAKLAVTGKGGAAKSQVQSLLQARFRLKKLPPEDAADALALALCHFHRSRSLPHV